MNWRPDGWVNRYRDLRMSRSAVDIEAKVLLARLDTVYEQGADAMLEALKAQGIRLGDIDWHTWMDAAKELGRRQFRSPGCLTFIPDEEKGGKNE